MIPKMTQLDTTQVTSDLRLVGVDTATTSATALKSPAYERMRPELRRAIDESWERDEDAYRYLGR